MSLAENAILVHSKAMEQQSTLNIAAKTMYDGAGWILPMYMNVETLEGMADAGRSMLAQSPEAMEQLAVASELGAASLALFAGMHVFRPKFLSWVGGEKADTTS